MDYKILYTEPALEDLQTLMRWSWEKYPETSERFGNTLLDHIGLLARFPRLGSKLRRRKEVRKLLHSPIRVYYRVNETRRIVEILRFAHIAQVEPQEF